MTDREIEHLCDLAWQEKYLELKRNGIVLEFQGTLKKTGKDDNIDNTQI